MVAKMPKAPQQYPLKFSAEQSLAPQDYIITDCNAKMAQAIHTSTQPVMLLCGAKNTGKTHFIRWLADQKPLQIIAANTLGTQPADHWMHQPNTLYVIEDIDKHISDPASLAQAINLARALPAQLLLSAVAPFDAKNLQLPDLQSRLKAAQQFTMPAPDDALRAQLLHKYLSDLQWRCAPEVRDYILTRLPRDMHSLQQFVAAANLQALAEKRALTIPFAAKILQQQGVANVS
jgi:chromosomal replication initiation ATPase DnaA